MVSPEAEQAKPTGPLEASESGSGDRPAAHVCGAQERKHLKGHESDQLSTAGNLNIAAKPKLLCLIISKGY